ncbi:MAG: MauE/DoxX family redox-associated membrane protein [Planctomycetota bacterium]
MAEGSIKSGWQRLDASGLPLGVARLIIGGVFVWAAVQKIADPVTFLKVLREYQLLPFQPPQIINGVAVILPWVEVVAGLALITGVALRPACILLATLLVVFTGAIYLRATQVQGDAQAFCSIAFDCGCGGEVIQVCRKLLQNTGLVLVSMVAIISRSRRFCLPTPFMRSKLPPPPAPANPL